MKSKLTFSSLVSYLKSPCRKKTRTDALSPKMGRRQTYIPAPYGTFFLERRCISFFQGLAIRDGVEEEVELGAKCE